MVLRRVREQTASLHEAVEQKLQLTSPQLTLTRYTRVIQAFLGFFAPWEAALEAACPDEFRPLWVGAPRAQKLRADLHTLGASPAASVAMAPAGPISSPGEWLGAFYVLEGSRLGGQHISRHLEGHFHWIDGRGYSFFYTEAAEIKRRWQAVCSAIEEHEDWSNQIVLGSHRTFEQLEKYLNIAL